MREVAIVGVGRVGGALALALPRDKYHVGTLVTRGGPVAARIAAAIPDARVIADVTDLAASRPDIVFVSTRDPDIADVAAALRSLAEGTFIYHNSGSQASTVLIRPGTKACHTGSIHPLVSVSSAELGPERFRDSYFCIEGDAEAVELAAEIVTDLGGRPFTIDTKFKTLYHASAVTACGHLVALFDAAIDMMSRTGLSAEESKQILLPLVLSTVNNLSTQSLSDALTGTFARADSDTFSRHISALNQYANDELLEIYLLLGERSLELAARQGVSAEKIERLRSKVAIAKSKLKW